jgi:rhomboid family GlyGly-CTERM serine protease
LLTGHLLHWTSNHRHWDVAALVLIGVVCERHSRLRTVITLALAALIIPLALLAIQPDIILYRGLSGLDAALFALLAAMVIRDSRGIQRIAAGIALLLIIAKTAWEFFTGGTMFVDAGGVMTAPLAHAVGIVVGTGVGIFKSDSQNRRERPAEGLEQA